MSLLTQDSVETKTELIFALLDADEKGYFTSTQVEKFLTIYLIVSCNYLAHLGKDYPAPNRASYY